MNTFKYVLLSIFVLYPALSFSAPAGFFLTGTKEITEDMVRFHYLSNDGTLDLKCTHLFDKPDAHDWDVWCGKGTKWLRQFRVHFLVRKYQGKTEPKSAYEVLYWVIDRDQPMNKAFASTSSWIQFNNPSNLERLSFSQGVENDYAYLTVELTP
ncbi:MAG: hypothetical protein OM95_04585 [Bdellovibrio sp. ArHS]|uniref:hypothetical protein n=1 Tax=Bdellovibrio sp. ArHS TaxID=1569284 RepID=UPI00058352C7|nr:hypothetical protein [Bdellovibrio sp. ArHS]KHD89111.1 MAG: hypothetical protein OM95_04585 [Bdellovibrio sp. ArHS]